MAIGDRRLLLMLDEAIRLEEQVQAGKLETQVFDYLRHLMQHHPRLNFLFSLGSGLEEMQKEYAFLFNVALYKKISFLDRASTEALVTEPVKGGCPYQPEAVERILQVTSGHPYFTQLICHSLFNRCQGAGGVTLADVEAVLDEAVERGLAVLKHVWEESTPGEKAALAAMASGAALSAAASDPLPAGSPTPRGRASTQAHIVQTWAGLGVTLPESEAARAVHSLVARDVIAGAESYAFTVDLMRLWVEKFRRLEWVKEEIEEAAQGWARREQERLVKEDQERALRDRQQRDREIQQQAQAHPAGQAAPERSGGINAAGGKTVRRAASGLPVVNIILALAGLLAIVYFASALLQRRSPAPGLPVSGAALPAETSPAAVLAEETSPPPTPESLPAATEEPPTAVNTPVEQSSEGAKPILGGDAALVSDLAALGGYVWAATEAGLVRWNTDDGTYRLYPGSDLGLPDDCINTILADPDNDTLWLGCGGVAAVRVEGDELSLLGYYNRDDGLGTGVVQALAIDSNGTIWAGGFPDEGDPPPLTIFTGDGEDQPWQYPEDLIDDLSQYQQDFSPGGIDIRSIWVTPDNTLLLGLKEEGILYVEDGTVFHFGEEQGAAQPGLEDSRIRGLLVDSNGTAWAAASQQGLLRIRAGEQVWEKVESIPAGTPAQSVAEFPDGNLWAGGDHIVGRSEDGGEVWTQVGSAEGLGEDIGGLVMDENGNVWAGSYGQGVSVWDGETWHALQQ